MPISHTLRRKAILIGILAATVLRIVFALMTTWLMGIIGLILLGGILLLWVCWKMYRELTTTEHQVQEAEEALDDADTNADGTISARAANGGVTPVGKLKLVTPEEPLQRSDDGLFRPVQGDALDADANARVQGGALEGSNVNPIEAMVGMIAVSRQFETQMRMLQNGEKNDQTASRLLNVNG